MVSGKNGVSNAGQYQSASDASARAAPSSNAAKNILGRRDALAELVGKLQTQQTAAHDARQVLQTKSAVAVASHAPDRNCPAGHDARHGAQP